MNDEKRDKERETYSRTTVDVDLFKDSSENRNQTIECEGDGT